jgi:HK97 family phage prohead protease
MTDLDSAPEMRYVVAPLTHVEVRDPSGNPDDTWTMSGYAAVFNQSTVLFDSKFIRLSESIDPAFFDRVLREQPLSRPEGVVHYNFGHDMNRAVAATDVAAGQPGSLLLSADAAGLHFLAKVPRDDPDGVAMAAKMRSGVLRQASFAFTISEAKYEITENDDGPDEEHRLLLEAKHLYDVCACAQGAYPQTVSGLRSYAAAIGQPVDFHGGQPRQPDLGGESAVNPVPGGGAASRRLPAHVMRAAVLHRKALAHEPEAQEADGAVQPGV